MDRFSGDMPCSVSTQRNSRTDPRPRAYFKDRVPFFAEILRAHRKTRSAIAALCATLVAVLPVLSSLILNTSITSASLCSCHLPCRPCLHVFHWLGSVVVACKDDAPHQKSLATKGSFKSSCIQLNSNREETKHTDVVGPHQVN